MLSAVDLERLIAVKRLEIEKEKTFLGLSSQDNHIEDVQQKCEEKARPRRSVSFSQIRDLCDYNVPGAEEKKERDDATEREEDEIPSDLERYIRRYLGLPVMLKAGEFSPNNPLVRGERASGDALLGLGEYERRRNTLRRLRQQQYREYLDQQAKKKQEAKEQAEKERREREEREREQEEREREREREEREREREERERERERLRDAERRSPERRRASANTITYGGLSYNKVDTGVQVDCRTAPLSVAVQTDDADLFRLPPSPTKSQLTQAERELSPHTVADSTGRPQPTWALDQHKWRPDVQERRRSYGDFDERSSMLMRKSNRDKLSSELRHSYMPSIFDADAIQQRNLQAEKEAAARRQYYQQELKNQIMEQQRIREERKTREKLLEAAEVRRLEQQLRELRAAHRAERARRETTGHAITEDNKEYDKKRKELQKDIDDEQLKLTRAALASQPPKRPSARGDCDKLPFYYPLLKERNRDPSLLQERTAESAYFDERPIESSYFKERSKETPLLQERPRDPDRKPYSTNIPDDSIFSPNYDVDSYLRRNLNFKALEIKDKDYDSESVGTRETNNTERNVEKVSIPDLPKVKPLDRIKPIPKERKSLPQQESVDSLPIPVLRHSPVTQLDRVESGSDLSDAMKKVDDKWKVPVVQKNILRSIPNDEGKSVSILTQLGSIRRQLQLEQLKLDRLSKDDDVA